MTDKQRDAARNNGAKSNGPATPEGKERASLNARAHQLTAAHLVLKSEEQSEFDQLLQTYFDELHPQGEIETALVEQMAAAKWRERRCWLHQKSVLDVRSEEIAGDWEDITIAECAALAFGRAATNSQSLQLLQRYETMHARTWRRAWRDLLDAQKHKLRNEPRKDLTTIESVPCKPNSEPFDRPKAA